MESISQVIAKMKAGSKQSIIMQQNSLQNLAKQENNLQIAQQVQNLIRQYQTFDNFLKENNPSKQLEVCRKSDLCFFGSSPTLTILDATYGKLKSEIWLTPQIIDVSLNCGLKEDASKDQIRTMAIGISTMYQWLKVDELMLFFFRFKLGIYERFYSRFDTQTMMESFRPFLAERGRAFEVRKQQIREIQEIEDRKSAITYEEYCQRHNDGSH